MSELINESNRELLDKNGKLKDIFFGKKVLMPFNKQNITKLSRIKEWDNYVIQDGNFILSITIANHYCVNFVEATVIDLDKGFVYSKTSKNRGSKGVILACDYRKGISDCKTQNANFRFENNSGERVLKGNFNKFYDSKTYVGDLEFNIKLSREPKECYVNADDFKTREYFLFSQTVKNMVAEGSFTINGKLYTFDKSLTFCNFYGGRGVFPYRTKSYKANLQTRTQNKDRVGFSLNQTTCKGDVNDENVIFYNGQVEKVGNVSRFIQREGKITNYMGGWTFYSDDGKIELYFEPLREIKSRYNYLVLRNFRRQILGFYSGVIKLDSGKEIEIKNALGFAEQNVSRW